MNGWTPLDYAVVCRKLEVVKVCRRSCSELVSSSMPLTQVLLDRGANVEAIATGDWTALHQAVYYGVRIPIVKVHRRNPFD